MSKTASRVLWIIAALAIIAAGIFLIVSPRVIIGSLSLVLGIIMLISGISTFLTYFSLGKVPGRIWTLIDGVVSIILSILILSNLFVSAVLLVIFFGGWIFITGIMRIITAFRAKKTGFVSWWVILVFGIISAALGIIAFLNPLVAASVLSFLIGGSIVLFGIIVLAAWFMYR